MVLHAKQAATAMCVYAKHSTVEQTVRFVGFVCQIFLKIKSSKLFLKTMAPFRDAGFKKNTRSLGLFF
jgi:hypothetical protein